MPNFQNWKAVGAQALVTGRVESQGGDKVRVEFRLWDVLPGQQIQGTAYTTTLTNWRRIAHIISDVIYERLLGEKGYFDTRIVYIAGTGPRDRRIKRLAIMDQDGENNRFLTDGSFLALTPRFHPTKDEIAFMSYANNRPRVYLFDLGSGRQQLLGDFHGITLSPRFSPDGNTVVMAADQRCAAPASTSSDLASRPRPPAHRLRVDRRLALLQPGRHADRLQLRPRRRSAALRDERGRIGREADQLRAGPLRDAGLVAARRPDRLHPHQCGSTFAIGVMHPDGTGERILSESWYVRGPDLRAQRAGDHVLARDAGARHRAAAAMRRGWSPSTSPASTNGK